MANALLFGALGVHVLRRSRHDSSPRLRALSLVVAVACAAFFMGALQRMALQALWVGWLDAPEIDFLLTEWQLVQSLAATALGVGAWVVIGRAEPGLRKAERMVTVLTERIPLHRSVSELGLTPRELQVLELIGEGLLSDEELADALYVSSSTVRTHVRNLLRKAGVSNRRQLMLLAGRDQAEPTA